MLTKVKMWKTNGATSGFEVTYTAPKDFVGWDPIVQKFGTEGNDHYKAEEITLEKDLQALEICLDDLSSSPHDDFEGFNFIEYGGRETKLSPSCNWGRDSEIIDLVGKRLVGFKVVVSDYGSI